MADTPIIFLTLENVKFFKKPYFDGKKWHNLSLEEGEQLIFLSETRSKMLRVPVGETEEPSAYVFSIYGQGEECYFPVYNRTKKVVVEDLYPNEIVTNTVNEK
jgi:hypothetical protein